MVAKYYNEFDDSFEVFHSGAVRFGDGHIIHNNKKTFSVPFSFFAPKGLSLEEAKEELFNEHFLTKKDYEEFISKNKQLKQQRSGFLTLDAKVAKIKHNYRQKSAYDSSKRKSKDSAMFGYYALEKGSKWAFCVELDNEKYKDKIIEILEKSKRLGKSKSAEYGRIKITFLDEKEESIPQKLEPIEINKKYYIFLYAYSRLALTNQGINSFDFDLESLCLSSNEKISWDKSNIRTYRYTPYNFKRENRDFERLVIDKGSVIAIEVERDFDVKNYNEKIKKGVGLFLSEGHGKVIINPIFLTTKTPNFSEFRNLETETKSKLSDSKLVSYLKDIKQQEEKEYKLLKEVKEFIKNHNVKNKKSQWGQIRSICSAFMDDEKVYNALFAEERGFLMHGKAKEKWDKKLIQDLKNRNKNNYHSFIKLLSIYAPKEDDKGNKNV